jgi:hypothetical protein
LKEYSPVMPSPTSPAINSITMLSKISLLKRFVRNFKANMALYYSLAERYCWIKSKVFSQAYFLFITAFSLVFFCSEFL